MSMKDNYTAPAFVVVAFPAIAAICVTSQENALPKWETEEDEIFVIL